MSDEEARAVIAVLAKTGGSPDNSPRKHTQAVYSALCGALHLTWALDLKETELSKGSIYFEDYA